MNNKNIRIIILFFLILPFQLFSQIKLLDNKKSDYVVVLPKEYNTIEKKAADVFRYFFTKSTGVNLPIINQNHTGKAIIIKENNNLNPQAVMNFIENGNIILSGGRDQGVLYASIHFLKQVMDIDWLGTGVVYIPEQIKDVILPENYIYKSEPDFKTRSILGLSASDEDYRMGNFLHPVFEGHHTIAHTFSNDMLPPDSFFNKHPEFYALVKNTRIKDQPCLTNPDVFNIVKTNIQNKINNKENDKYTHYSISLEDNTIISEDFESQQIMKQNGGAYIGVVLDFVNKVATNFPNKTFTTLAYMTTKKPPTKVRPASNIQIILTNADYDKSKSIQQGCYDVQQNINMKEVIPEWINIDPNLILWDYVANFTEPFSPWPIINTLQLNLQYYKSAKIKNLFFQDGGLSPLPFSDLKSYLLSNLMWDVNLNTDSLIKFFCKKYYGQAMEEMYKYITQMNNLAYTGNQKMFTYDHVKEYRNSIFTKENISKWQKLINTALIRTKNSEVYKRVLVESMALDYLQIVLIQTADNWAGNSKITKNTLLKLQRDFSRKNQEIGILNLDAIRINKKHLE